MTLFTKHPHPILEPQPDIPWATGAVFNPGACYDGSCVHLLFRAIPEGYRQTSAPHVTDGSVGYDDYISYIGYAHSHDGVHFTPRPEPFLAPDANFDRFGAEDPRITPFEGRYLITYTALSHPAFGTEDGVRIGLASTTDFQSAQKHGIIGPPRRDKDAVLFPRRIGGRIAMLHRIEPDIQIVYFDDLDQLYAPPPVLWEKHLRALDTHVIMRPEADWERKKIGAGPPPIETDDGWLIIYHGVDHDHVYRAGLALLDRDRPEQVLARHPLPVLEPDLAFERTGDIDNVVFPEGAVVINDILHLYYGAADRVIGYATAPLGDVLTLLRRRARTA